MREAIERNLQEWKRISWDEPTRINEFYLTDSGKYTLNRKVEEGPAPLTHLNLSSFAETQILARLKIPAAYFHRCPATLQEQNFNYWKDHKEFAKGRLILRHLKPSGLLNIREDEVRAIVTNRYHTTFDDVNVIPQSLDLLFSAAEIEKPVIVDYHKDTQFTKLFVAFNNLTAEHNNIKVAAGIAITNSEVGLSCLHIRPYIRWHDGGSVQSTLRSGWNLYDDRNVTSFYHSGEFDLQKILDAITESKKTAQIGISELFVKATHTVKNPWKYIQKLHEQDQTSIPNRLMDMLEAEWKEQRDAPLLTLARSILEAVKSLPVFAQHLATQKIGRELNLFTQINSRWESVLSEDIERFNEVIE